MDLILHEPEQQAPLPPQPRKREQLKSWVGYRFATRNSRDHYHWRVATGSMALFGSIAMATAVLGMPTGLGTSVDLIIFLFVNLAAMSTAAIIVSFLFHLLFLPFPRRFLAVFIYTALETYFILYYAELGELLSAIVALSFTSIGALAGMLLASLMKLQLKPKGRASVAVGAAAAVVAIFATTYYPADAALPQRAMEFVQQTDASLVDLALPNPSKQGDLAFDAFTYGSGQDKHRSLFGKDVNVRSSGVDASAYITKWSGLKTRFWGFDEHELPLNGRVWMPEGEGPFPIALMVHGNHLMEDFSDGGYDYLGELLASKGIIAVSVDENFLNYSVWSGIPNNDMKVRAWVLLKHLQQIKQFSETTGNPFYAQVDLEKVALIGHSRGGQAVAMAADSDRWFRDDQSLGSLDEITIESVIAIAPTDKQVDDKSANLSDVNYLTLQGARDADVNNFYGDRQYSRTTFQEQANQFKAALYIADANHSQFNSDWGRMDERPPGGLFLSRKQLLKAEEQRQISKVYVSAFLQATLLGDTSYKSLFKDYRVGLAWLPQTLYTNRYEEAQFTEIARYDNETRKTSLKDGVKATATGMKEWQIASAEDRDGKNKGTKGIELEWHEAGAEYELVLSPETTLGAEGMTESNLVFSMANLERDLLGTEGEQDAANSTSVDAELPPLPVVEIEVTTLDGESRELELADVMPVAPPAYTSFMTFAWLEERIKDEKYKEATEPVFQTYVLPMEQFSSSDSLITPKDISRIKFRFVSGPGKVMLDDIGFMP
ncbi:alpha/beta hydrolase family protein [Paenibacillus paridis]|uniref:alpha/beta hydrolase family protein n=1 Tax=Paenibacillus paridis TaxID=2583376 RepID=UPI001391A08A|nr:alpha/beta hydrolase [Paenibacillus paridis]